MVFTTRHKLTLLVGLLLSVSVYGQTLNGNWNTDLKTALADFQQCQLESSSQSCYRYIGQSLNTVYSVNDFYSNKVGRYMTASEIAVFLKDNAQWKLLGNSYDQKVLSQAQELANAKKAVVAVYMNEAGIGHVALITPGQLSTSGSWGLQVPNTASFFPTQADKSFIDKGLSFAFAKNMLKDIKLYSRNY